MNKELKELCAQWWADRLEIPEKCNDFKQALLPLIHEGMWLKVDYDPNEVLLKALHEAGIKCRGVFFSAKGIFPMKISMRIRDHGGDITVKEGYGGGFSPIE